MENVSDQLELFPQILNIRLLLGVLTPTVFHSENHNF